DAQDNIPFPVEVLPTRNSLPTPIIAHTLADRSVVVPVRGGKRPEVVTVPSGTEITVEPIEPPPGRASQIFCDESRQK
ncbi:hypothetical protein O5964_31170, partial [Escherichia coli]|nr:hypothetical protein [Escherichia coli]